jgi:hypothetical protein
VWEKKKKKREERTYKRDGKQVDAKYLEMGKPLP